MKLTLKSTQVFENNTDEIIEEYNCRLKYINNEIVIEYNGNGSITIKENSIIYKKSNNIMVISLNEETDYTFKTLYGNIFLHVYGIQIEKEILNLEELITISNSENYINKDSSKPILICKIKYKLWSDIVEPYLNILEISII